MHEKYLEMARFPTAELTAARGEMQVPAPGERAGTATAQLQLHGVDAAQEGRVPRDAHRRGRGTSSASSTST